MDLKSGKQYIFDKMFRFAQAGGVLETPEIAAAKLEICRGCDYMAEVEPIPGVKFKEGCKSCGCPLFNKTKYKSLMRLRSDIGKPITVTELIKLNVNNLLNNEDYVQARLTCPHKDGDKWRKNLGSKLD